MGEKTKNSIPFKNIVIDDEYQHQQVDFELSYDFKTESKKY